MEGSRPPAAALLTIQEFCAQYGVRRTSAYKLLKNGAIQAVKIGRATRIVRDSAERWVKGLPRF